MVLNSDADTSTIQDSYQLWFWTVILRSLPFKIHISFGFEQWFWEVYHSRFISALVLNSDSEKSTIQDSYQLWFWTVILRSLPFKIHISFGFEQWFWEVYHSRFISALLQMYFPPLLKNIFSSKPLKFMALATPTSRMDLEGTLPPALQSRKRIWLAKQKNVNQFLFYLPLSPGTGRSQKWKSSVNIRKSNFVGFCFCFLRKIALILVT